MAGKVKVLNQGPSGKVQYTEGLFKKNVCEFYFEFGAGDTVAIITVPAADKWDAAYPWAGGRRKEILTFVAEELRRTQAPSSSIVWEEKSFRLVKKG
jgi:hypothetical protein